MTSSPNIMNHMDPLHYKPSKTVADLLSELRNPKPFPKAKSTRPPLDIEHIRAQMKKKWRDPGSGNSEFIKAPILRAKLLNEWQYERIYQAQRSYKAPKGKFSQIEDFKGIKFDINSRRFAEPSSKLVPQKFNHYLQRLKTESSEKQTVTNTRIISQKKQRIIRMLTQNASISSSNRPIRKSGMFGFSGHKKMKTIDHFLD